MEQCGEKGEQNTKREVPSCWTFSGNGIPGVFRHQSAGLYRLVWCGWALPVILRVAITVKRINWNRWFLRYTETTILSVFLYSGILLLKDVITEHPQRLIITRRRRSEKSFFIWHLLYHCYHCASFLSEDFFLLLKMQLILLQLSFR